MIISAYLAIALYGSALLWQALRLRAGQREVTPHIGLSALRIAAVLAHGVSASQSLMTPEGFVFGLMQVNSLIFFAIMAVLVFSQMYRPMGVMLVLLFPLAILSVILSLVIPPQEAAKTHYDAGLANHILTSILAYALLTIAAVQAMLVSVQHERLRDHRLQGLLQVIPPLQSMEHILFQFIGLGFLLLSTSIVTGFLFFDDLFAQHLMHKTVLSMLAWVVFAVLLAGHLWWGWRGPTASRWTLWGFGLLLLAYAGSQFVLEFLL